MTGDVLTVDTLLRGMIAGVSLLVAAAFLARRPANWRRALGALFAFSACGYILGSSPAIGSALGPLDILARLLAVYAPVFFWWFALALFDDGFRWRWPVFAPLALQTPLAVGHYFLPYDSPAFGAAVFLARLVMVGVYAHVIYTALRFLNDDLIEGRRRFRVVLAIAVAVTGLIITSVETTGIGASPPAWLLLFQASAILLMTLGFAIWLVGARSDVLDGAGIPVRSATLPPTPVRAADRPAYDRLAALMEEGVWREEGLTVAALAGRVGLAEHQLRRLINQELGFRNFSAFLNARRIEEAKAALADPAQARRQILQIALDTGFGSIAPFNRAFKEATGMTPTEFRKKALGEA